MAAEWGAVAGDPARTDQAGRGEVAGAGAGAVPSGARLQHSS